MYKALFVPSKNSPQILENLFCPPTLRFHRLVLFWFPLAAPVARLKLEPGVFAPLPNAATAPPFRPSAWLNHNPTRLARSNSDGRFCENGPTQRPIARSHQFMVIPGNPGCAGVCV